MRVGDVGRLRSLLRGQRRAKSRGGGSERGEAGAGPVESGVPGPSLSLGSEGLGEGGGERRCEPRDRPGSAGAGSGRLPVRAGGARRRSFNLNRPECSRGVRSGARSEVPVGLFSAAGNAQFLAGQTLNVAL